MSLCSAVSEMRSIAAATTASMIHPLIAAVGVVLQHGQSQEVVDGVVHSLDLHLHAAGEAGGHFRLGIGGQGVRQQAQGADRRS